MKRLLSVIALLVAEVAVAQDNWPTLEGPYLGQETPGLTPQVFAPGLISLDDQRELNSVFSPNGRTFMFSRVIDGTFKMFFSFQQDGVWSKPRLAGPSRTYPNHRDVDMAFSPDGDWLYFISDRPLPGYSLDRYNIWRSRITPQGLATPEPLGPDINGPEHELYPVLAADGSLFFSAKRADSIGGRDSYRAAYANGEFAQPVNLGPGINSDKDEGDIYVSPDQSYIIHVSADRADSLGGADLYISFRQADGRFGQDIHMGDVINSSLTDYCPMVTPDGRFFFFTRGDDIMWMDAAVVETFR